MTRHEAETSKRIAIWLEGHAEGYEQAYKKGDPTSGVVAAELRKKAIAIRRGEWKTDSSSLG
jgi:hypothetical protein